MKAKIFKLGTFLFVLILLIGVSMIGDAMLSGGYLQNTTNNAITDTLATTSANDTGYVFYNPNGLYKNVEVQFTQNGKFNSYVINSEHPEFIRTRYRTSDSTMITEVKKKLGYFRTTILINGTVDTTYTCTAKTGNAVITMFGYN